MLLEKALPRKRALLILSVTISIAIVSLLVFILLAQLDLVSVVPRIPAMRDYSLAAPPGFVFNIYGEGKKGSAELVRPMGISLGGGQLFVTDGAHGLVRVFDRKGNMVKAISLKRNLQDDKGELEGVCPVGIAVGEQGAVYVSDLKSSSIMTLGRDGRPLGLFPNDKEGRSNLKRPLALAAANGDLYVTDIGDQSVKVFNETGKLLRKFGRRGEGEGEFSFPNGIAVSKDGLIFVADSNNSRVQVFSSAGKFKFSIRGKPPLSLPRGLAIDSLNRLHVTDTLAHRVSVFTLKGEFLFFYGWEKDAEENPERQLYYPNGITVDGQSRRIYVTDKGNNRVSVWEY